jgi:hypothetical protein
VIDLLKGKLSLRRTFWIYGVGIWILLSLGFARGIRFALSSQVIDPGSATVAIIAIYLLYTCMMPFAIWRSAGNYKGKRIWAIAARIYAALMYGIFLFPMIGHLVPLSLNPNTAFTINRLHPSHRMPFVGFWKENRHEQFGVAIDDAGNGLYSISFCGPGGCFEPTQWRKNTTIVNDPSYRVIDKDTIEFVSGHESSIYRRFTEGVAER